MFTIKKSCISALCLCILASACAPPPPQNNAPAVQSNAPAAQSVEMQNVLPNTLLLDLPFFTQAPFGNWDYPWQESCEEASISLVANLYLDLNLNAEKFNETLLKLVDWQMENFGAYEHSTLAQTAEMMEANFGLKSIMHENPSFADIQKILNKGNLIVAPFAGKLLKNPNFTNGGPIYHMLVINGYDAKKEIIYTHDVGTRKGENYKYDWAIIQNALHDWHDSDISQGKAVILEILPAE